MKLTPNKLFMFTGIIEEIGKVREITPQGMWIDCSFRAELNLGQSVACDGVCLTVVELDATGFRVDVLEETKRLTSFSDISAGSLMNLERAMKAADRFDGHIVQAHSEGVATLVNIQHEEQGRDSSVSPTLSSQQLQSKWEKKTWLLTFSVPQPLMKYMILKGIVILNGIALTITSLDDQAAELQVAIIPHTWENTNLHSLQVGAKVNVETDVLAKYLERLVTRDK